MGLGRKDSRLSEGIALGRARQGLTEFGLVAVLFMMYFATRGIAMGNEAVAFANAHAIMNLQRRLGIFWEIPMQSVILAEPVIVRLLNFIYVYTHMTALIAFAVWAFLFHQDRYREIRNTFLLILTVGLAIYILYPLAPPRFFPYTGFVDTLALYSGINHDQPILQMLYNPFAAMPSLHVAFALFVGIGLIRLGGKLIHWVLGIIYPLLMMITVIGTGNHFILDVVAGCALTVAAFYLAPRLGTLLSPAEEPRPAETIAG